MQLSAAVHETALRTLSKPGSGLEVADHAVPSHDSVRVWSSVVNVWPTAVQLVGAVHETPLR
jgi:hypothetical protein